MQGEGQSQRKRRRFYLTAIFGLHALFFACGVLPLSGGSIICAVWFLVLWGHFIWLLVTLRHDSAAP